MEYHFKPQAYLQVFVLFKATLKEILENNLG